MDIEGTDIGGMVIGGLDKRFAAGRDFLYRQGRLLDRRLFATCFEGAPGTGVVEALRAYRNEDGGFGHGLEPDKRCPASLPIDVEVALQALATARAADPASINGVLANGALDTDVLLRGACDYLAVVAAEADRAGAVPLAFPVIEAYPRAAHWTEWTYEPGLNPTAGLVGLLYRLGADHPWIAAAADYCWSRLDSGEVPGDAHTLSEVMVFLENSPERVRAEATAAELREHFGEVSMLRLDPDAAGYGLTPLNFAPAADSRWRGLFDAELIDAHLDRLAEDQESDGGWPIAWEPPSEASQLEWRGIVTLQALRTLASYGRLDPRPQR